jgi:hypothetical protein
MLKNMKLFPIKTPPDPNTNWMEGGQDGLNYEENRKKVILNSLLRNLKSTIQNS